MQGHGPGSEILVTVNLLPANGLEHLSSILLHKDPVLCADWQEVIRHFLCTIDFDESLRKGLVLVPQSLERVKRRFVGVEEVVQQSLSRE